MEDSQGRLPGDSGGGGGIWLLRGGFLTGDDPNQPDDSFHHFHTEDIACCPMAVKPRDSGGFNLDADFGSLSARVAGKPGSAFEA